jgi:DNA-3-methyladenine glycosylase II
MDRYAEPLRVLAEADERLAAVIRDCGPCRLGTPSARLSPIPTHFVALVEAIVSQQLSVKAADTIFNRVVALGGGTLDGPERLAGITDESLRGAGLSKQKIAYMRDLSVKMADGTLALDEIDRLPDEEVIESLRRIKGIGRWTAEMFLIFRLGRPDVLPVADLGIQKGMKLLFGLRKDPSPDRMVKLARPWRPYRSIACWYLWRLYEKSK